MWFRIAYEMGVGHELEARSVGCALAGRSSLPRNHFLTVNIDPDALESGAVMDVFGAEGDLRGVVVEITEHHPLGDGGADSALERLRSLGAMIALDDAGSGYAGMQQILRLRPSILKVDRSLVDGVDVDESKVAMLEMLGTFANRVDAWVVAEGVETAGEAARLAALGIPLVQGFFFARPSGGWPRPDRHALDALVEYPTPGDETLHHLLEDAAVHDEVDARRGGTASRWQVVVDGRNRPYGLVDAQQPGPTELVPALTANVATSPLEIAHRVVTHDAEPCVPVVVVEDDGRCVGIVTLRRLVAHLAEMGHETDASASITSSPSRIRW